MYCVSLSLTRSFYLLPFSPSVNTNLFVASAGGICIKYSFGIFVASPSGKIKEIYIPIILIACSSSSSSFAVIVTLLDRPGGGLKIKKKDCKWEDMPKDKSCAIDLLVIDSYTAKIDVVLIHFFPLLCKELGYLKHAWRQCVAVHMRMRRRCSWYYFNEPHFGISVVKLQIVVVVVINGVNRSRIVFE